MGASQKAGLTCRHSGAGGGTDGSPPLRSVRPPTFNVACIPMSAAGSAAPTGTRSTASAGPDSAR
jgi:hypothetical protein